MDITSATLPAPVVAGSPEPALAGKPAYPPPAPAPTQSGTNGIRFDFNMGARVLLPWHPEGGPLWRVRLRDSDTGNVLFESENRGRPDGSRYPIQPPPARWSVAPGLVITFRQELFCWGRLFAVARAFSRSEA